MVCVRTKLPTHFLTNDDYEEKTHMTIVGEELRMKIRKATLRDLPEIKRLSKKFKFEISRDWKALISSKNSEVFVLMNDPLLARGPVFP